MNFMNINAQDENGWTKLMHAVYEEDIDKVKFLLQYGANVNAKDNDGVTSLMWASENNNIDMVKLLLCNRADVNAKNKYGETALWFGYGEVIDLLKQYGAKE